jgi:hypothetical protein
MVAPRRHGRPTRPPLTPLSTPLLAAAVLGQAIQTLARLRLVRGASRRTGRQIAHTAAIVIATAALLKAPPAAAATPRFVNPLRPFGLSFVEENSRPAFGDLDGDGDLDLLLGRKDGRLSYFENTGTALLPAFDSPVTDPFGLADVGDDAAPRLVDIDGDGDLDAFVGDV